MPATIHDLLVSGRDRLDEAGIDDAELSVRYLLEHLLSKSNSQLQSDLYETVSDEISLHFEDLIEKRAAHHPLQYLIGEVEFYNVKLKVDNRVLIPRPETEILVEHVIELLQSRIAPKILDIGTGSGNIAIALAANVNDAFVTSVDISSEALDLARENARLNKVGDNVSFIRADCLDKDFWNMIGKFDAVISNPPYVDSRDYAGLQPEVRDYEPKVALVNDQGPLVFFEVIAENIPNILTEKGLLCFEIGAGQAPDVTPIIKKYLPSSEIKIVKDLNGIDRVITALT